MNNNILKLNGLHITIASPIQIIEWASRYILKQFYIGEIILPLTIDYALGIPKEGGLFCEKIFGPIKSWTCLCNKIPIKNLPTICNICGSELNDSIIRKYRMGIIKLNTPIINPWFINSNTSILPIILNIKLKTLLNLIYYKNFNSLKIINYINNLNQNKFNINNLTFIQQNYINYYIFNYLKTLNILELIEYSKELLLNNKEYSFDILKKIYYLNIFFLNKFQLTWIFLEYMPIIPPSLRTITKLNSNNYITSPINIIYKNIILHNNRIIKFIDNRNNISLDFEINEKIFLQKSIQTFFNLNLQTTNKKSSITNILIGKYGRFRSDLLGKRIDFSSRSVITSGADINFSNVGIPIIIAISLYKPLLQVLLNKNKTLKNLLINYNYNFTLILIRRLLTRIFKQDIIILNRAPTLHRMNIQAFKPYLIEGYAIKIYPIACSGFNADFDGDQMSILLCLTKSSRLENKYLMSSDKNIISPATGLLIYKLNQNIILGLYNIMLGSFMTNLYIYIKYIEDIIHLYTQKLLTSNSKLWIKVENIFLYTTLGTLLLNNINI